MLTRQQVLASYQVDSDGLIIGPSKFEGCMLYIPAFNDKAGNGYCDHVYDENENLIVVCTVSKEDREEFPEVGEKDVVCFIELDNGFVYEVDRPSEEEASDE